MSKCFRSITNAGLKQQGGISIVAIKGFSLVELLIALFVFALMSGFAYRSVNTLMVATETVGLEESELTRVQRSFLLIEKDVRAALRIEYSAPFPDEGEGFSLDMADHTHKVASSKKSIHYVLRKKDLYRQVVLNEAAEALTTLLLSDVENLKFTAIDSEFLRGGAIEISHGSLGALQRQIVMPSSPADSDKVAFANLNTLVQLPPGPSTVGGSVEATEDEVPFVLDEADIVADGW